MRSSTLVLLFLISVQAAVNMEGEALVHGAGRPRNKQSGPYVKRSAPAAGHHQDSHRLLRSTSPSFPTPPIETPDLLPSTDLVLSTTSPDVIPTVDPRLFKMWRYHSPRVLFSAHPPDAHLDRGRVRARRHMEQPQNRGLFSVCKSVSGWANKTKATDIKGNDVMVLPEVNINNVVKKQYFFETVCRDSQSGPSSCLGVDGRRWNSYCTNTHTFVRALTSFGDQVAWRHIRINVACVCVLSRKSWSASWSPAISLPDLKQP